tara:strand:+ start:175 stop:288 length:114 start_codon:yes stop_codon:yes gene_type:complete
MRRWDPALRKDIDDAPSLGKRFPAPRVARQQFSGFIA